MLVNVDIEKFSVDVCTEKKLNSIMKIVILLYFESTIRLETKRRNKNLKNAVGKSTKAEDFQ